MEGREHERWQELCAQAAKEQDPAKLLKLIDEITRLLDDKTRRLQKQQQQPSATQDQNSRK